MTDANQQNAEARQRIAVEQHAKDIGDIIEIGRNEYGTDGFDEASNVVAGKIGERMPEFMALVKQFDFPHRLVSTLANQPDTLERLAKLPLARQATELARIEGRTAPHGHVATSAEPEWKNPAHRGRISDADWSRTGGAALSDKQWSREWDRRQAERNERRR